MTVFSAASRQLRVIQAYYNSEQGYIVVRKSKILDFKPENCDTPKLVMRWMIGDPIGETRYKTYTENATKDQAQLNRIGEAGEEGGQVVVQETSLRRERLGSHWE